MQLKQNDLALHSHIPSGLSCSFDLFPEFDGLPVQADTMRKRHTVVKAGNGHIWRSFLNHVHQDVKDYMTNRTYWSSLRCIGFSLSR